MVEKLELPFPIISDPDRAGIIEPMGVADPKDERNLARPALILLRPDGSEAWRFVSRDFADRLPEDEVLEAAKALGLEPTTQPPPEIGESSPGRFAMTVEALIPYFRGARFAALAMGLRHGHIDESIKADSKAYVAEMDRYFEAMRALRKRQRAQ